MGDVIRVLITGAGAPGTTGTIWSLINNEDMQDFYIVGCDTNSNAVGKELCDDFYKVYSPAYHGFSMYEANLKDLIEDHKIDVIIPQTTDEVSALSCMHTAFAPVKIVCSLGNATSLVNNKWSLIKTASNLGVPCPRTYYVRNSHELEGACFELGYPNNEVVIKPSIGNGSRGVRIVSAKVPSCEEFFTEKPDGMRCSLTHISKVLTSKGKSQFLNRTLLVQEYLPGAEYTVDVYQDDDVTVTIPRRRDKIVNGISFENTVEMRQDIIKYSTILAQNIPGLQYCFGFQFKLSSNGEPKLLECNPRVQGTMIVSTLAGYNMIYNAVLKSLGREITKGFSIADGMKFKRVWGGVCINAQNNYVRF